MWEAGNGRLWLPATHPSVRAHRPYRSRHSSDKKFTCPFPGCTRNFYEKFNLNRHIRQNHKQDIEAHQATRAANDVEEVSLQQKESLSSCAHGEIMACDDDLSVDGKFDVDDIFNQPAGLSVETETVIGPPTDSESLSF
jgi:hypothetical protein